MLKLAQEGSSNREIAQQLFISELTVKKHMSKLMTKLGASNRTFAVIRARKLGLL